MFTLRTLFGVVTFAAVAAFCLVNPNYWTDYVSGLVLKVAIATAATCAVVTKNELDLARFTAFAAFGVVLSLTPLGFTFLPYQLADLLYGRPTVEIPVDVFAGETPGLTVAEVAHGTSIMDSLAVLAFAILAAFITGLLVSRSRDNDPRQ